MARGVRVIAVSEQIALLVNDRYGTSWDRIVVVPASVDTERSTRRKSRASASTRCARLGASGAATS